MEKNLKYWYLRDHKLFRNLSFSEIDALCILNRFKKSPKNEIIDLPFSNEERIYVLKKGTIKLIEIDEEGNENIEELLQSGDIFGDLNFEHSKDNATYFKVVSDEAIICTFFRKNLEDVMIKKPDFAISYIKFIGFKFKKFKNSYKNIFFKDTKTRLILLLYTLIEGKLAQNNTITIPNYLNQNDLAQLICTTRQTIITLLKELKNEGILQYSHNELQILDIKKIKEFAENVK